MTTCADRSFISAAWSSRRSSDLARSVSRCVPNVHGYSRRRWRPGRGDSSGARMLVRRWWICYSSLTSSMGGDISWSKIARGRPPLDVPHRHVRHCMQRSYSSNHKSSLAMALSKILHWWRLDVSYDFRLGDGAFSDLALVEARRLLRLSSWRRWRWAAAARYGGCRNLGIILYFSIS
jgi:hypothetical protein